MVDSQKTLAASIINTCMQGLSQDFENACPNEVFPQKVPVLRTGSERSARARYGRGSGGRSRPPEAKGSTCSEMHSQGYPRSSIGDLGGLFDYLIVYQMTIFFF